MIQLSELIGHEAIDVETATTTGQVTGIGLVANRIASVGIGGECVDAAAIRGFDGDVVTYEPVTGKQGGGQPVPVDPRGSRVLDMHGDLLGTISDLTITNDGVVDVILLNDGHSLHGTRLRVLGTYAAIVSIETP